MKYLDVKQMLLASSLAETGSLTKTAKVLHLSQPAISHQLKALEKNLGVQVFERQGKKLIPNPIGRLLAKRSQQILIEIEKAIADSKKIAEGKSGVIKLAVECYTCYSWLPKILKEFSANYPDISVEFYPEATLSIHESLNNGTIDAAIVTTTPNNNDIYYQKLFNDDVVIILNKNHSFANEEYLTLEKLLDEPWIFYSGTKEKYKKLFFNANNLDAPKKIIELQLTEAIIEWVKNDLGITMMARWAAAPYMLSNGPLKAIPLSINASDSCCRDWYVAAPYEELPKPWETLFDLIRCNPPTTNIYW